MINVIICVINESRPLFVIILIILIYIGVYIYIRFKNVNESKESATKNLIPATNTEIKNRASSNH